ncbi:enkurin-like [Tiliqua scincoides]|uniref:enkurin-like n=1 Tax=Tiliqua scincoides TaxID=71010 RepID=UPI003462F224
MTALRCFQGGGSLRLLADTPSRAPRRPPVGSSAPARLGDQAGPRGPPAGPCGLRASGLSSTRAEGGGRVREAPPRAEPNCRGGPDSLRSAAAAPRRLRGGPRELVLLGSGLPAGWARGAAEDERRRAGGVRVPPAAPAREGPRRASQRGCAAHLGAAPAPVRDPVQGYVSQFRASVTRELRERPREPCRTMGLPRLRLPSPGHFLRRRAREPPPPPPRRHRVTKKPGKPSVPPRTEHPVMGVQSKKNFIATNAAEAIMAVPKKPLRACVDVRQGDKFLLENSGLVKKYLQKKDFGTMPRYLVKLNEEAQRAQEEADTCLKEVLQQKRPQRISREERETLLEGLKRNWEEINQEFQGLSVVTGTIPRRLHREKLETQMKQLEHDISAIEKHCFIYVARA